MGTHLDVLKLLSKLALLNQINLLNTHTSARKKTKKKKKSAPEGKLECPFRKKKQRIKETPEFEKIKEKLAFEEHKRDSNMRNLDSWTLQFGNNLVPRASIVSPSCTE